MLDTVITLDGDDKGLGGYVRPDVIRTVLAEVAAVVDNNTQVAKSASERRRFANDMAKGYEAMAKSMAEADAKGELGGWARAQAIEPGTVN
ncbi:hypothetical protein AB2M62_03345 [Sphingomonas sp. MMS12-HWE2-04]|uniref:hypothetical protein n=1 Tax=Sphingomonas sp. MMS12-HWE2-04 TaxID=3234199 RepID=UPI00384FDD26